MTEQFLNSILDEAKKRLSPKDFLDGFVAGLSGPTYEADRAVIEKLKKLASQRGDEFSSFTRGLNETLRGAA